MAANTRWVLLVIVGVVLALASVLADWIGVGAHPDFGWKQIVGVCSRDLEFFDCARAVDQ
jgi:hypothetical protein